MCITIWFTTIIFVITIGLVANIKTISVVVQYGENGMYMVDKYWWMNEF